jgi:hypothetical protein
VLYADGYVPSRTASMTGYSTFNVFLAGAAALSVLSFARSWYQFRLILRIAFVVVCITFPWDFVGIHLSTWAYPSDPGIRIASVPLNDLYLSFLVTVISCSALVGSLSGGRITLGPGRSNHQSESEHRDDK